MNTDDKFVIGDIHGEYEKMTRLLLEWNCDSEQLILLGDYIDRGPDSKKVLKRIKFLREHYGAILLSGNHEETFLEWLKEPYHVQNLYFPSGGYQTVASFLGEETINKYLPEVLASRIKDEYPELISEVKRLRSFYHDDDWVFVHAGVDLSLTDWKQTRRTDFMWMREPFFYAPNHTGNKFVFGHTPTRTLHEKDDVWISKDGTRIGIDGGAVFGGKLHAIRMKDQTIENISVNRNNEISKRMLDI